MYIIDAASGGVVIGWIIYHSMSGYGPFVCRPRYLLFIVSGILGLSSVSRIASSIGGYDIDMPTGAGSGIALGFFLCYIDRWYRPKD